MPRVPVSGGAVAAALHHSRRKESLSSSVYSVKRAERGQGRIEVAEAEARMLKGMHKLVQEYLERKQNYLNLGTFLIYFGLYIAILALQKNAEQAYSMESTMKDYLTPIEPESGKQILEWSHADNLGEVPACSCRSLPVLCVLCAQVHT